MQSELKEVMHALSHLSSTLPGDTTCLALKAPASPCRHGRQEHKSHHKELERLRTEVALLRVRRTACLDIHPFQTVKLITSSGTAMCLMICILCTPQALKKWLCSSPQSLMSQPQVLHAMSVCSSVGTEAGTAGHQQSQSSRK